MTEPTSLRLRRHFDDAPLPLPDWPPGIVLIPFDPAAHAAPAHALLAASYEQGGGSVDGFADWWKALRDDSEYDPTLCFVLVDGAGTLVAFAQCWTSGWVKDIAVAPAFRRRGVARALMLAIFAEFQRRGLSSVGLGVHVDNDRALRLYRALGMA